MQSFPTLILGDTTKMKTYLECLPCLVHQALDAVRMVTDDEDVQAKLVRQALSECAEFAFEYPPPVMGARIQEIVREGTGADDPYRAAKQRSNEFALELLPGLAERVERADDPFGAALRLAAAANVIDLGAKAGHDTSEESFRAELGAALDEPLPGAAVARLKTDCEAADSILYLADNAGEIVFDRLFIEHLPAGRVTVAVRGGPILNDATAEDARQAGIPEVAELTDNGTRMPGTVLEECSAEFRDLFREADVVISKGQGNYETLSEVDRDIFFLLRVKCPVLARDTRAAVGKLVLLPPGP